MKTRNAARYTGSLALASVVCLAFLSTTGASSRDLSKEELWLIRGGMANVDRCCIVRQACNAPTSLSCGLRGLSGCLSGPMYISNYNGVAPPQGMTAGDWHECGLPKKTNGKCNDSNGYTVTCVQGADCVINTAMQCVVGTLRWTVQTANDTCYHAVPPCP